MTLGCEDEVPRTVQTGVQKTLNLGTRRHLIPLAAPADHQLFEKHLILGSPNMKISVT